VETNNDSIALCNRILAGDSSAFSDLKNGLKGLLYRYGNGVEDFDSMLNLWIFESCRNYDNKRGASLKTWVVVSVGYAVGNYWQARRDRNRLKTVGGDSLCVADSEFAKGHHSNPCLTMGIDSGFIRSMLHAILSKSDLNDKKYHDALDVLLGNGKQRDLVYAGICRNNTTAMNISRRIRSTIAKKKNMIRMLIG